MATCTELYVDTLGGLGLDGSTDKNLQYFVMENLVTQLQRVPILSILGYNIGSLAASGSTLLVLYANFVLGPVYTEY